MAAMAAAQQLAAAAAAVVLPCSASARPVSTRTARPACSSASVMRLPISLKARSSSGAMQRRRSSPSFVVRAALVSYAEDLADDDYLVVGKAHCFVKQDGGKLVDCYVVEPIPAGALECMDNGGVTCYEVVTAVKFGDIIKQDIKVLPEVYADATFCEDFEFRTVCTARTWKRAHAEEVIKKFVPLGTSRSDFNLRLDDKRVLNMENVVTDDDNIKQDLSIDVYGRSKEEEEAEAAIASSYNA
eukprot:jgi/Chlat1/1047/Chrsp110S01557